MSVTSTPRGLVRSQRRLYPIVRGHKKTPQKSRQLPPGDLTVHLAVPELWPHEFNGCRLPAPDNGSVSSPSYGACKIGIRSLSSARCLAASFLFLTTLPFGLMGPGLYSEIGKKARGLRYLIVVLKLDH
ncbi:hypothetical protein B296_00037086 [Ensete ventricosum]|uniref:Uncharacterized protein n=1 Tax=Ensete ventricosum TaxID=4639 RepID=A0A427A0J8_ENSVE|nr:hypothetical protein B296_00037086 [Ensete ventricosum]